MTPVAAIGACIALVAAIFAVYEAGQFAVAHFAAIVALFALAALALAGRACWSIFEPHRKQAVATHRARVRRRPRPMSQWSRHEPDPPPMVKPVRDDIQPTPGRRMVAIIPDEHEAPRDVRSSS